MPGPALALETINRKQQKQTEDRRNRKQTEDINRKPEASRQCFRSVGMRVTYVVITCGEGFEAVQSAVALLAHLPIFL